MGSLQLIDRLQNRYRRALSNHCARRMVELRPPEPIVSFTFDDFPHSALEQGGAILKDYGGAGTYYVSMGLMDTDIPAGPAFTREDLPRALAEGHELGCHTFSHCHAWDTDDCTFEESSIRNQIVLNDLIPGAEFRSLSYPIALPRPGTKRRMGERFDCCRSTGGSSFNIGWCDASNLQAHFLEKHRDAPERIKALITENARVGGWLILATHDVCDQPSPFGCTPKFFKEIVRLAAASKARLVPVVKAWKQVAVCV